MEPFAAPHLGGIRTQSIPSRAAIHAAKAAQDFEASLLASLLESLEKSFVRLGQGDTVPGGDDYKYLGTQALAETIASKGGFGIASMILAHVPHEGIGPTRDNSAKPRVKHP